MLVTINCDKCGQETHRADVILKPLSEEHLEWARRLHNDPDVLGMLTDPHVVTKEEQVEWFAKLKESTTSERLVAFVNGTAVGVVRVDQIDKFNNSVCVGLDIHKDFRGLGFAKPIYKEIFRYWFEERWFERVWLFVADFNEVARNLYKSLGFVEEGAQRKALNKGGLYYDYIMMSVLREEYENGK